MHEAVLSSKGGGGEECVLQPSVAPCTRQVLDNATNTCPHRPDTVWFHGGYGAVFSRGLLKTIGSERWGECERDLKGTGDARIAECIWNNGFG
jgi:hypothetical protein